MRKMTWALRRRGLAGFGLALAMVGGAAQASAEGCRVAKFGTLPVEVTNGRATTMVKINDHDTRFILDTGSFFDVMSRANADALGLKLQMAPPGFYMSGIGGDAGTDLATVKDFGILDSTLHNILFVVGGSDMGMGLLGANLLLLADLDLDLANGKATLLKPNMSCQKVSMAYWAPGGRAEEAKLDAPKYERDRKVRLTVMVNGKPVRAILDTGAPTTLITRKAALRSGIDLSAGAVTALNGLGGFGQKRYSGAVARVALYQVGSESIQNSRMSVIDSDIEEGSEPVEMLIGLDFALAHHIFIAHSQRKMYFTYNGGRVSNFDKASELSKASTPPPAPVADLTGKTEPDTAAGYALRAQARLSRGEHAEALADFDKAVAMAPDKPDSAEIYFARARARLIPDRPGARIPAITYEAALADVDKSLALAPDRVEPLLMRARLRLQHRETQGALEDIATLRHVVPAGSEQARAVIGLLIQTDQPREALPLLDDWLHLHPEDSDSGSVYNSRCWARALANTDLEEAAQDCRKAIKRLGPEPGVLDSQALVELRMGHWQAAYDGYVQVLAKAPNMAWSRYGQALAMLHLGKVEEGKAQLAAVTASNPNIVAQAKRLGLTPS